MSRGERADSTGAAAGRYKNRTVLRSSIFARGEGLKSMSPCSDGSASSCRRVVWYLCCSREDEQGSGEWKVTDG